MVLGALLGKHPSARLLVGVFQAVETWSLISPCPSRSRRTPCQQMGALLMLSMPPASTCTAGAGQQHIMRQRGLHARSAHLVHRAAAQAVRRPAPQHRHSARANPGRQATQPSAPRRYLRRPRQRAPRRHGSGAQLGGGEAGQSCLTQAAIGVRAMPTITTGSLYISPCFCRRGAGVCVAACVGAGAPRIGKITYRLR